MPRLGIERVDREQRHERAAVAADHSGRDGARVGVLAKVASMAWFAVTFLNVYDVTG